jgi:hypothetical protein
MVEIVLTDPIKMEEMDVNLVDSMAVIGQEVLEA